MMSNELKYIEKLVRGGKYFDAASLAISEGLTYETRRLFSRDKGFSEEKVDSFEVLLLADARKDFDIYNQFLDYRQPLTRNLYRDRRKYLKQICDIITNMYFPKKGEKSYDVVRIKLRTRSAKSEIFNRAMNWVQSNFPTGESLYCVGGGNLRDNQHGKREAFINEYWHRHQQVFPEINVFKTSKDKAGVWFSDREYADITTVTVGGSIEGHVQVTNMLVMDDLVSSNEINSVKRLEEIFSSDIMNAIDRRRVGTPKVILIGTPIPTLTGIQDPLDRYYDYLKTAGFEAIEVVVPSLNENNESNYAFRDFSKTDENGEPLWVFTTEEFLKMKKAAYADGNDLTIATYETVYQMQPMTQGSRIFSQIRTFESYPEGQFQEINVLDPADKGSDTAALILARIYDSEPNVIYIDDMYGSKKPMVRGEFGGFLDELVEFLVSKGIKTFNFEENLGGELLGHTLVEVAEEKDALLNPVSYVQTKNKRQRINDHAPAIIEHVRVREKPHTQMYQDGVDGIKNWSMMVKHDDYIDGVCRVVEIFLEGGTKPNEMIIPPFRL